MVRNGEKRIAVYALVDGGGVVVNLAHWDGGGEYKPEGVTSVPALSDVAIGDVYANGTFTAKE